MSTSIPNAWVHAFHPMLLQTMQQTQHLVKDKLLPRVKRTGVSAAIDHWERLGNVLLQPVGRHTQTVELNPNHSRRGATIQTLGGGILLSPNVDVVRMLIQPQSDYRELLAAAAVQSEDQFILAAAIGNAMVVTVSSTTGQLSYSTQAMLSTSPDHVIGNGAAAINLTTIIQCGVLLSKGSVPTGAANRVYFYAPGQEEGIMEITQASSSDFTKNRIHDSGTINGQTWQGFEWVMVPDVVDETKATLVNMLPLATADRTNIAMYRGAVGVSSAQEITPDIARRPDLNNEIQVYVSFSMGAVRLFEAQVVENHALEE